MEESDIVLLDSSDEDNSSTLNGFNIAPPNICERWSKTTSVQSSSGVIRTAPFQTSSRQSDLQPIITEVKSLSPYKNQARSDNFKLFSTVHDRTKRRNSRLKCEFPIQPIITDVKSLSPFKSHRPTIGVRKPTISLNFDKINSKFSSEMNKRSSKPVCIDLDDGDDDPSSVTVFCVKSESQKSFETVNLQTLSEKCEETKDLGNEANDNGLCMDEDVREPLDHCITMKSESSDTNGRKRVRPIPVDCEMSTVTIDDFISACKAADTSLEMESILEKKVKKHYNNADKTFKSSSSFQKFLRRQKENVENDSENLYVHISDLVDELKARKGKCQSDEPPQKKTKKDSSKSSEIDYTAIEDARIDKKIKKLSKTLATIQKMVKKLEEKEVSWSDEDDANSSYIMLQRYKDRGVKVFNKICEYTKESNLAGKLHKIPFSGTPFPQVNKCIENFVNKTGNFPDYIDILEILKKVNAEENLINSEKKLEEIAKKSFHEVGEELQRQRRYGVGESLLSFLSSQQTDPADNDSELRSALAENKKHWQKIDEVINDFATRAKAASEEDEDNEDEDDDEADDQSNIEDPEIERFLNSDDENENPSASPDSPEKSSSETVDGSDQESLGKVINSNDAYSEEDLSIPEAPSSRNDVVDNADKSPYEKVLSTDDNSSLLEEKSCNVSTTKDQPIEMQGRSDDSVGLGEPEGKEKTVTLKSETIETKHFKIRVRSAKSLGGVDFGDCKSNDFCSSAPDDIIVLD